MTATDFEHPIDASEEARALGEASCTAWLPSFMRWAAARVHDLEILLTAAYCDGFRAGLKAGLEQKPARAAKRQDARIDKWHGRQSSAAPKP